MKKTFLGILGILLLVSVVAFAAIIEIGEARTVVMVGGSVPAGCAGGSDGVIGTNAAFSSDSDEGNASTPTLWWSNSFTPSNDGSITYGHYATHYNTVGNSRIVLMDTSGNVLDYSELMAPNATEDRTARHAAMTNDYCLVSGISYIVAIWIDADNYAGATTAGNWGTGHSYWKSGMTWSTVSFNLTSPNNADANRNMYGTLNNSADTP